MAKPYPISICMAGAVSAGSYSAGVMAELLDAVRLWKDESIDLPFRPEHSIKFKGISGASAGSIQAVLTALDMFSASSSQELGKHTWLSVSLKKLLSDSDLDNNELDVKSLLNSESLGEIANKQVAKHRWADTRPNYISEEFKLRLSITNLRGVPYNLKLPFDNKTDFGMSTHNEYIRFVFEDNVTNSIDSHTIQFGTKHKLDFDNLIKAALASSAFPIAFAPVNVTRPRHNNKDYHSEIDWLDVVQSKSNGSTVDVTYKKGKTEPAWVKKFGPPEEIYAVDGGATNNEPLVEAFKILLGDDFSEWRNVNDNTQGKVLFVDPFPNSVDKKIDGDNLKVDKGLGLLVSALIGHARFSEHLIPSENLQNLVGLIYPSIPNRNKNKLHALRSGGLSGFTGFLKQSFMEHDYELGRLNMRRFLRYHFTTSKDDEIFNDVDNDFIEYWGTDGQIPIIPVYQQDDDGAYHKFECENDDTTKQQYYDEGLQAYRQNFTESDRENLRKLLKTRFKKVGEILLKSHTSNDSNRTPNANKTFGKKIKNNVVVRGTGNFLLKMGWRLLGAGFLTNAIVRTIENDLAKQGYLDYQIKTEKD